MLLIIFGIIVILLGLFYYSLVQHYGYWEKRGIPTIGPPFPGLGNIKDAFFQKRHVFDIYMDMYKKFDGYLYGGFYNTRKPALLIRDPEIIKDVLVKKFNNFHKNDVYVNENVDPFASKNPFVSTGEKWRTTRNFLSPLFTSGKLKAMFPLMIQVTDKLVEYLKSDPDAANETGLSAKEVAAKYTTDVTALCGFGIQAKSFTSVYPEFREMGRKIMDGGPWNAFKFMLGNIYQELTTILRIQFFTTEVVHFFKAIIQETIVYRETNGVVRNDVLDYMIHLKNKVKDFGIDDITAHSLSFYIEGFETSSAVLSYMLYDVASNKDVFDKLRIEIDEIVAENNGEITYDDVQKMKYLDCVFSESLRVHAIGAGMTKVCTEATTIPHHKGLDEGPPLTVQVGTIIVIPITALHMDSKYFPDPEKFDPDRFSEERKDSIDKFVYLPFSEGPRQCLGTRYALAQIKAAIVAIVKNFDLKVHSRTIVPFEINPCKLLVLPKGDIWINFYPRKL